MSISGVILVLYYHSTIQKLDALTQLLNRQAYERMISKINFTTIIIMIDANNFKAVNDTFGHECGDKVLKKFAKCILKTYKKYGYCYRIGGDEFCVILKPGAFKELINETQISDVYAMSEDLMKKLDDYIDDYCNRHPEESKPLQFGVSQGYGIYYLGAEYPSIKNNMPLGRVIRLADLRMYRKKEEYRKQFQKGNRSSSNPSVSSKVVKGRPRILFQFSDPEFIEDSDLK